MFQQSIKCGPFLRIEGKGQPLQKNQKVCIVVGLLATLRYVAINRKADVAILKEVYFDLASVFEVVLKLMLRSQQLILLLFFRTKVCIRFILETWRPHCTCSFN